MQSSPAVRRDRVVHLAIVEALGKDAPATIWLFTTEPARDDLNMDAAAGAGQIRHTPNVPTTYLAPPRRTPGAATGSAEVRVGRKRPALIARNQTADLLAYLKLALDSGVKPSELSGIITHAMSAVAAARPVFAERASSVDKAIGASAPALAQDTTDVLFRDLWLRPDLTPRDRSLVTICALIATGQFEQLTGHLTRALNNGLTQAEASETISHLAYYGGWPNAFSAASIARAAFAQRSASK